MVAVVCSQLDLSKTVIDGKSTTAETRDADVGSIFGRQTIVIFGCCIHLCYCKKAVKLTIYKLDSLKRRAEYY